MIGPGKYDDECTAAMKTTNAAGIALIIFGGDRGDGFSVQATGDIVWALPDALRAIATMLETDQASQKGEP